MPARRTFENEAAELAYHRTKDDERREQAKLRMRAMRARNRGVTRTRSRNTATRLGLRDGNPPTPPVKSLSLLIERVGEILAPFAGRGYVHVERFWTLAHQEYPELPLELEAYKIADWLEQPKNSKRRCSRAFLGNWLSKAAGDRQQRESQPRPRTAQGGPVDPPIAFQTNPGPDPAPWLTAPLQTFTPEEIKRLAAEHARVPFKDKLAAKAALATNGVHK